MLFAVLAYFNVEHVSSNPLAEGVTVAMIVVFALPPKLSFKIRVSLLSGKNIRFFRKKNNCQEKYNTMVVCQEIIILSGKTL